MRTNGLVSVVIPSHNYARFVGDAVESVLSQTYEPIEVIVVDNGSTDGSLEVLARLSDRCRIFTQEDLGQAGGRNRGIAEADGEFIAFLDADDAWSPTKLERQMELFTRDPLVGLIYCSIEVANAQLVPTGRVLRASHRGDVLDAFAKWPGRNVVVGGESSAVVRRSALETVGRFEPTLSISSGWDLWRRIATHYRVDYVADALVLYRQHGPGQQHRRLRAYEADVRAASRRMFDDPAAIRVRPSRCAYEVGLDLMFAKTWLRNGDPRRALVLSVRALASFATPFRPR